LASEDDLNALFDTLSKFKDFQNHHPVITANAVVANPDFEKIKKSGFTKYHYELITDTFKKYPQHSNCLEIWQEGERAGLFHPQLHGKEHLNVSLWLKLLQNKHPDFLAAFENNCWGLSSDIYPARRISVQAAFDAINKNDLSFHKKSLKEACEIFEEIFGYRSESFIANNFIWDPSLNKTLFESGVKYLQGMKYQKIPLFGNRKREMIRHYLGEKNEFGQHYLIRNCCFEPSQKGSNFDNVGECMKEINNAFLWNKPAIISSHRINYVGYLDSYNRDRNLLLLQQLLKKVKKNWPEVEFLTSDQLGTLIEREKSADFSLVD
jgi:hypothetical protein